MFRGPCFCARTSALLFGFVAATLFSSALQAATINYGSFGPVMGTSFLNVSESSITDPVPLYGPPSLFAVGLDFNPAGFGAFATNGAVGSTDVTDGQLNFTITNPLGIASVSLFEGGDYTLSGTGTAATNVSAGAIMRLTVLEINGVAVAPILLPAVNASVSFNLLANPGVASPWSLGLLAPIALPGGQVATAIGVSVDNVMSANSEPVSTALIAKKEFIITTTQVPEPGTVSLVGLGLCGLVAAVRRKRSLVALAA